MIFFDRALSWQLALTCLHAENRRLRVGDYTRILSRIADANEVGIPILAVYLTP